MYKCTNSDCNLFMTSLYMEEDVERIWTAALSDLTADDEMKWRGKMKRSVREPRERAVKKIKRKRQTAPDSTERCRDRFRPLS